MYGEVRVGWVISYMGIILKPIARVCDNKNADNGLAGVLGGVGKTHKEAYIWA